MSASALRKQLHQQVEKLPEDILHEVADFTAFVLARRQQQNLYADWTDEDWREFSLQHFFRDGDEVTYSLADAEEVFQK